MAYVAASEGSVIHRAVRRCRDSVRATTPGCGEYFNLANSKIEPAIDAILTRKPKYALAVKSGCVEVGITRTLRQRINLHGFGHRVDTDDGIETTVRDPRLTIVGPDDHAVRSGACAEWNVVGISGLRIEAAKRLAPLSRIPDGAIGGRGNVVRA